MRCPKSVRTAAIVSQSFIVAWAALIFLSSIFQNSLLGLFISSRSVIEDAEKILPAVTIIDCFKSLILSAVNILMCKSKCIHAPLIITAVTLGIFPIACSYASRVQILFYANQGEAALVRFNSVSYVVSLLSYLLTFAGIITIAAAAVYAYAKKNTSEKSKEIIHE